MGYVIENDPDIISKVDEDLMSRNILNGFVLHDGVLYLRRLNGETIRWDRE